MNHREVEKWENGQIGLDDPRIKEKKRINFLILVFNEGYRLGRIDDNAKNPYPLEKDVFAHKYWQHGYELRRERINRRIEGQVKLSKLYKKRKRVKNRIA